MEKHLTGKLFERAAAPVQSKMGEIPLTKDHTLNRNTTGAPACRLALSSR